MIEIRQLKQAFTAPGKLTCATTLLKNTTIRTDEAAATAVIVPQDGVSAFGAISRLLLRLGLTRVYHRDPVCCESLKIFSGRGTAGRSAADRRLLQAHTDEEAVKSYRLAARGERKGEGERGGGNVFPSFRGNVFPSFLPSLFTCPLPKLPFVGYPD
jgi:hypothetical protein